MYSGGLVFIKSRSSSVRVEGRASSERAAGLVFINSRSSSTCVEGRARQ